MYDVIDSLQGRKPPSQNPPKAPEKPQPPKRCCHRFINGLRALFLRLRAAVLVLLATFGLPLFYMSLYMLLGPGLATLAARFHTAFCIVADSNFLEGKNNCTWSSCRQGCTAQEIYVCWHVLILLLNSTQQQIFFNQSFEGNFIDNSEETISSIHYHERIQKFTEVANEVVISEQTVNDSIVDTSLVTEVIKDKLTSRENFINEMLLMNELVPGDLKMRESALVKLQINVEGCGYRSCEAWWRQYGRVGTTFTCYLSADGRLAVSDVDYTFVTAQVVLGVLPLVLSIAACIIMYVLYCRKGSKDHTFRITPNPELLRAKWEEAKVQILLQRAKEQEKAPPTFGASLVKKVASMRSSAPTELAAGRQQGWSEEDVTSSLAKEKKRRMELAGRWRRIAVLAAQHPAVSPARRFTEVTLDSKQEAL